jgi:UDP-GlcNAc3NAcA epimerase
MKMKKILTVIGARPQFIKSSVVSNEIIKNPDFVEVVVHTGQHYDPNMSEVFFEELDMRRPDYHLGIGGGLHGEMTGRMLVEIERVLIAEHPDAVLVYGDTNSTLAGALAAVKLHIPVAHVEAGLRSFNMQMPEEINRVLTDRISNWLFTPTESSVRNLRSEGVPESQIIQVGDVMYDVALYYGSKVNAHGGILQQLGLAGKAYILATIHRAENTDDHGRLTDIVDSLVQVNENILPVVWPLHPRARAVLRHIGRLDEVLERLHILDPVGYLEMIQLEKYASLIATDSGGVQKEAFFYRIPCVTLRDETEWIELVESGWNRLAMPGDVHSIVSHIESALGSSGKPLNPYGNGDAAGRIINKMQEVLF